MKMIKKMVDHIDEELCGAEKYAEDMIQSKAEGKMDDARKYREMSQQELDHADFLHKIAVEKIMEIKKVYTPSQEMLDKWTKAHSEYVDKVARIKVMLNM